MDQETANRISKEGGLFILENFPSKSEFGIDCLSYQVGDKFKGLKMIPKGFHFIYFSIQSQQGQLGPRTGFFHYFDTRESLIKIFDQQTEEFSNDKISNDLINKYTVDNLPYFDDTLGPYPFEQYKQWISLTDLIDEQLLKRLNSDSKLVNSISSVIPKEFVSHKNKMDADTSKNDKNDLNFKLDPRNQIKFTNLDQLKAYPTDSTPQQITQYKIDNSFLLDQLIQLYGNESQVLGELQLAFIVFFLGQNFEAFEQWKNLFKLICKSSDSMVTKTDFFINFIRVIYYQLKEVPTDTFVDIIENNNFLLSCLRDFFLNIYNQEDKLDANLVNKCKQFQEYLTKHYDWEFDIEPEDEEPVVVDIN